jgi:subtilase family serine protease
MAAGLAVASVLIAVGGCSSTSRSSAVIAGASGVAVRNCLKVLACYAPQQFRVAYGIQPLLDRGIDGRGETVVLLELPAPALVAVPPAVTDIRQDLARFDSMFGLPAARVQVVNSLARSSSPWLASGEEVEDTEIVHAVAPEAGIREVLISDAATASPAAWTGGITAALRLGITQGAVISSSWGVGEHCFTPAEIAGLNAALQAASDRHVTVVNSSGDLGPVSKPCLGAAAGSAPVKGVDLLGSDPLTLAAGGTSLRASHTTGAYIGETAWNTPADPPAILQPAASGGGFSQVFSRPAYQDGVPGIGAFRGVPDVAADAAGGTGMTLAVTDGGQNYILAGAVGTSAAAPFWAAVIALADQYAGRPLGFVNPALYRIGRSPLYHRAFHDVTTGTNTLVSSLQTITGYRAGPGWNPVTGWGSPNARVLVPLLARYASP